MNNTLIERLLEHLWLQARLSQNTLQAYRHDLEKIAARLALNHLDWLSAQNTNLAAAIYHPDEQPRSQARALLLNLLAGHGFVTRQAAGIEHLPKEMRPFLRKIGVTFGALDIFAPLLLKPAPRQLLSQLGIDRRPLVDAMLPVIPDAKKLPSGYRHAGSQAIRLDLAEKIFRAAHEARAKAAHHRRFRLDLALPVSIGLEAKNAERLLGQAGFRVHRARPLPEGAFGPPQPDTWEWRPVRKAQQRHAPRSAPPRDGSAFAGLAELLKQG